MVSVSLAPVVGLVGETLFIEDLMKSRVQTQPEAEEIRKRFQDDPSKKKLLLDQSSRYAILLIEPLVTKDIDQRRQQTIQAVRQHLHAHGLKFRLAGMGVMHKSRTPLASKTAPGSPCWGI
ncbi:MAG: hypothetical protein WA705_27855 [Candidatus Ozemobacteraceae bacterium]